MRRRFATLCSGAGISVWFSENICVVKSRQTAVSLRVRISENIRNRFATARLSALNEHHRRE
jgi:hypothetical protein